MGISWKCLFWKIIRIVLYECCWCVSTNNTPLFPTPLTLSFFLFNTFFISSSLYIFTVIFFLFCSTYLYIYTFFQSDSWGIHIFEIRLSACLHISLSTRCFDWLAACITIDMTMFFSCLIVSCIAFLFQLVFINLLSHFFLSTICAFINLFNYLFYIWMFNYSVI